MILSDRGIKQAIAKGHIFIDPPPPEDHYQTSAVDIALGEGSIPDLYSQARKPGISAGFRRGSARVGSGRSMPYKCGTLPSANPSYSCREVDDAAVMTGIRPASHSSAIQHSTSAAIGDRFRRVEPRLSGPSTDDDCGVLTSSPSSDSVNRPP